LNNFWFNKRVLVTGHTGFKGAWLCIALHHLGAKITGISSDENNTRLIWNCIKESIEIDSVIMDINESDLIKAEIERIQPEIIFHLAAQPLVYDAFLDPINTVKTNVLGTMNILDSLRFTNSVRATLIITSDKVYDESGSKPFLENSRLGGNEIYSASKACAEILVSAFRNVYSERLTSLGRGIATARAGNVFGGGDGADNRLVPDIFRSILNQEPLKIRNPLNIRPWQHVFDLSYGYLLLAENMFNNGNEYSSSWNFSNSELEMSVEEILEEFSPCIKDIFGITPEIKKDNSHTGDFYETDLLRIVSDKSKNQLGWIAKMSKIECIEQTTRWYYLHQEGPNSKELKDFSLKSMQNYLERIK
jgi:CDP-glucose 4,6-dehydratase